MKNIQSVTKINKEAIVELHTIFLKIDNYDLLFGITEFPMNLLQKKDISDNLEIVIHTIPVSNSKVKYPIYCVQKNKTYSDEKDPLFIEQFNTISQNVEKTRDNPLRFPPYGVVNFYFEEEHGDTRPPNKWLDFLVEFYRPFCLDDQDLRLLVKFVILSLSANLRTIPFIKEGEGPFSDSVFVGYNNYLSESPAFPIVVSSLDTDSLTDDGDNFVLTTEQLIKNQTETLYMGTDPVEFFKKNGFYIPGDSLFDIAFIFHHSNAIFETNCLMPLLYKALIRNVLHFPMLLPTSTHINSAVIEAYIKIVEEEYNQILYYCFTNNVRKSIIYNMLLNKYL